MILTNIGCVSLEEAELGKYSVVRIESEAKYIKDRLKNMGIYEGNVIEKISHRRGVGVVVGIWRKAKTFTLGFGVSKLLIIRDLQGKE